MERIKGRKESREKRLTYYEAVHNISFMMIAEGRRRQIGIFSYEALTTEK